MIQEVDKRLDMSLHFMTPVNSYVLSTLVKENSVPINIYSQDNQLYVTYFLSNVSHNDRKLLETLNLVLMGEITVITEKIDSPVMRKFSENVDLVSTLTDGEVFTKGRSIYACFRFHSTQLKEAANLLRMVISLDENIDEIGFHSSKGIISNLDAIDERISLSVVTFSFKKGEEKHFVLEWRNLHRNPMDSIRYGLDGDNSVSNYDMTKEPTVNFLRAIDKDHIPVGSYLEFHGSERVEVTIYVPSILTKPLLVRLYETSEAMEDFRIENIEKYAYKKGKLSELK